MGVNPFRATNPAYQVLTPLVAKFVSIKGH